MSLTMIVQPSADAPLVLERRRRRDAVLARLFSASLDARLARGVDPESGRLLAARAAQLVDPAVRRSLAEAWDGVLVRAVRPPVTFIDPRVPIARDAVLEAATEIAGVAAALRAAGPAAARDVARARELLTDGASPVYVGGPVREVVGRLLGDLTAA